MAIMDFDTLLFSLWHKLAFPKPALLQKKNGYLSKDFSWRHTEALSCQKSKSKGCDKNHVVGTLLILVAYVCTCEIFHPAKELRICYLKAIFSAAAAVDLRHTW